MIKLQSYGFLQLAGGWHLEWRSLENFFAAVRAIRAPCEFPSRVLIAIEAHDGTMTDFATKWMRIIRALRDDVGACCRVLLTTRVREPLEWYISAWRWAGEPRLGQATKRGNWTFESWAPPNLQSLLMLKGDFRGWMDGNKRIGSSGFRFEEKERRAAMQLLDEFDLAWPVERFDDGMALLAKWLHLPPALLLNRSKAAPTHGLVHAAPRVNRDSEIARNCPDMSRCRALVSRIAPFDELVHRRVASRFAETVQQAWERDPSMSTTGLPPNRCWCHERPPPNLYTNATARSSLRYMCGIDPLGAPGAGFVSSPSGKATQLKTALLEHFGAEWLCFRATVPTWVQSRVYLSHRTKIKSLARRS